MFLQLGAAASSIASGGSVGAQVVEGAANAVTILVVACVRAYRYYLGVEATRDPEPARAGH